MPHNLYLHSAIVQTRAYGNSLREKREALKFATIDSTVALMFALLINASILILAAAAFHSTGRSEVAEIGEAHRSAGAAARLCLRADAVRYRAAVLRPEFDRHGDPGGTGGDGRLPGNPAAAWVRRLITRLVAIVPAAAVTIWYGESGTAKLLILSQVILSLQLSFAVIPLVTFTASRAKMGALVAPKWLVVFASVIAAIIVALNVKLLLDFAFG